MYITELFRDRSDLRYAFYERGTTTKKHPNVRGEATDVEWFDRESGKLFRGEPLLFDAYSLLDSGVDLVLDLGRRYFVDHITLNLMSGTELASLDALDENGCLVAHASPEEANGARACTLAIGRFAERITLRFQAVFKHIGITGIALYAAAGLEETVYPIPTSATYGKGTLPYTALTGIHPATEAAEGAAGYLAERLSDELGIRREVGEGNVRFVRSARTDDGYTLLVNAEGVTVTAAYPRSFFYAAAALMQLATEDGFRYAEIDDTPMMEIRGVHLSLPNRKDIPFYLRLFRELLVPMRYNMVILQLSGAMHYDCFPEINEAWLESIRRYEAGQWPRPAHYGFVGHDILTHDEVRDICAYIRSFGLEIIPEVQTLSHVQYITTAFPELAEKKPKTKPEEIDHSTADIPPSDFYSHNACPRHPAYYDYVLPLIDEVIDVIKPERYLHIGHDEGYDIGTCPRCKGQATEVFVEEVTRLRNHIADRGLSTMMWSDMLHPGNDGYHLPESAALLPKDIIMLDFTWYFELPVDIEDRLLPHGYRLVMGNLYSSHYPRYESRSKKKGFIGGQVSTWTVNEENALGYRGKFYDLVYTATMLWNPTYDSTYRLTYTELTKALLPTMRRRIGLLPSCEATEAVEIGGSMELIPNELLFRIPARTALRLTPTAGEYEIALGRKAELIEILHATDRNSLRPIWEMAIEIGEYVLVYEDGSEHVVPIRYSENILTYRHRYGTPIPSAYYRHSGYAGTYLAYPVEGKDSEGRDYTLLRFPVANPHPEKRIERIICRHNGNTDAEILVFEIKTN